MESSRMNPNKSDPSTQEMISKMKKYLSFDQSEIEAAWERLERKLEAEIKVFTWIKLLHNCRRIQNIDI